MPSGMHTSHGTCVTAHVSTLVLAKDTFFMTKETLAMAKEAFVTAKETLAMAKETFVMAKETYSPCIVEYAHVSEETFYIRKIDGPEN